MFDYLKCEFPLPLTQYNGLDLSFQTKDLGSFMDDYKIDNQGLLWRKLTGGLFGEDIDPNTAVADPWEVSSYTGELTFYTSVDKKLNLPHEWIEFNAEFMEGLLLGNITVDASTKLRVGVTPEQVVHLPVVPPASLKDLATIAANLQDTIAAAEEAMLNIKANNVADAFKHANDAHLRLVLARKGIRQLRVAELKEKRQV